MLIIFEIEDRWSHMLLQILKKIKETSLLAYSIVTYCSSIFEGKATYNIILPNPPLKKEGLSLPFSKGDLEGLYKKICKYHLFLRGF